MQTVNGWKFPGGLSNPGEDIGKFNSNRSDINRTTKTLTLKYSDPTLLLWPLIEIMANGLSDTIPWHEQDHIGWSNIKIILVDLARSTLGKIILRAGKLYNICIFARVLINKNLKPTFVGLLGMLQ